MKTKDVTTIYCDEAGFTGNDLFALEQPHFVYSSILIDPSEAAEVVDKTIKDLRIQSNEIKGRLLLNSHQGQAAATWILENYNKRSLVIAFEKRYSLDNVIRMELRMGAAGAILFMTSDGNASGARSVWASRSNLWDE